MGMQEAFDSAYITAAEICQELGINRSTIVSAKRTGVLPEPIVVRGTRVQIWPRDKVRPYIRAWKIRRGADKK